jgi:type VI secretion system protein ImpF
MRDRLQPALLDRLTDEAPQRRSDTPGQGLMTHAELRRAVLRDLRWLLNTVNLESARDLEFLGHIQASTLNFGVRAMAGKRMSEIDWSDLENTILDAIMLFEPRILPETLAVTCETDTEALAHHNIVSLRIKGMLWCDPYPQEFLFRTDIDLETGHMDLADMGGWA